MKLPLEGSSCETAIMESEFPGMIVHFHFQSESGVPGLGNVIVVELGTTNVFISFMLEVNMGSSWLVEILGRFVALKFLETSIKNISIKVSCKTIFRFNAVTSFEEILDGMLLSKSQESIMSVGRFSFKFWGLIS